MTGDGYYKARVELLRRRINATAYAATTQTVVNGEIQPIVYLAHDKTHSIGDLSWGEFVEGYRASSVRGVFMDKPGGWMLEIIRDIDRDTSVIVIEVVDAIKAGIKWQLDDGTLDISGRFVVAERFPMNYAVTNLVVRHIAGRPWRLIYSVKEAVSHHRIDPTREKVENLENLPAAPDSPYSGGW